MLHRYHTLQRSYCWQFKVSGVICVKQNFLWKLKVNSSLDQVLVSPDGRLFGQVRGYMQFTVLNTRNAKVLA